MGKYKIKNSKVTVKFLEMFNYWPINAHTGVSREHPTFSRDGVLHTLGKRTNLLGRDGEGMRGLSVRSFDFRSRGNWFIFMTVPTLSYMGRT